MNQPFKKTIIISFVAYAIVALFILLSGGGDVASMIGLAGLLLGIVYFFLASSYAIRHPAGVWAKGCF